MDGSRLVGILTHGDLLKALGEQGKDLPVQLAMHTKLETSSPSEELSGALSRMYQDNCRALVVVEKEEVIGLLTVGNIGELLALSAAVHPANVKVTRA